MRCGGLVYQMLTQILSFLGKGNIKLKKNKIKRTILAIFLGKKIQETH